MTPALHAAPQGDTRGTDAPSAQVANERRTCRRCDVEKPDADFYRVSRLQSARRNICKACMIAAAVANKSKRHPAAQP